MNVWGRRFLLLAVAALVGCYYLWTVLTVNDKIYWNRTQGGGFYEYLGRAFASGHLYLPIQPSPELLAQANPWDADLDDRFVMHDLAFWNGRYYLYHGAGPALMLFAPWQMITGYSLPESFAAFLLCFGGFLFSCAALLRIFALADARPGPALLAAMLLALGLCQCVPYLLNRVFMYEIAIAGGYFSIAAAVFFLTRGIRSGHSAWWLAASGLMFGTAISCRPHLGLAGAVALAWIVASRARSRPREILAFLAPFCLAGAAVAAYNYARFGSPVEFGTRYMLAASQSYRNIKLSPRNMPPGLYFMLFCQPDFSPVFPWVRQVLRPAFNLESYPTPKPYFIEATIGALNLAPMLAGLLLVPLLAAGARHVRPLLGVLMASALAILLFISATGLSSQRFEVDFLAPALLAALAAFGIAISRSQGWKRSALAAILIACVACGAVVGLALGITGPYNNLLQNRPQTYLRVARWFSPIERFRPVLNPRVTVDFSAEFVPEEDGFHEPLVAMGWRNYRYLLYAEHAPGKLRIISQAEGSSMTHEMERPTRPLSIRVTYSPESGNMITTIDGEDVLVHPIKTLVTAPAQVTVGEHQLDSNIIVDRFTGQIRNVSLRF